MSKEVTFCVLTYGDHLDLCKRAVTSILHNCPEGQYSLIIGANAISRQVKDYLCNLWDLELLDHLLISQSNLNKGRMMGRMLPLVETEYVWWFDDDSHIISAEAFSKYLTWAHALPPSVVQWGQQAWCDDPAGFTRVRNVVDWVRKANWFRGLPPPSWEPGGKGEYDFRGAGTGDGRWTFILGGCWFARLAALRQMGWPDRRLIRYGEDVLLGEAIRQQGWEMMNTKGWGLAIDDASRRGLSTQTRGNAAPLTRHP